MSPLPRSKPTPATGSQISSALQAALAAVPKRHQSAGPVWTGPEDTGFNGGITFSLLSRFLVCRRRFYIHTVDGLVPNDKFHHRMEYGSMWHICEEAWGKTGDKTTGNTRRLPEWEIQLEEYVRKLCRRYRLQQPEINKWYQVCRTQFPVYLKYWSRHPDTTTRQLIAREEAFNVPYRLPSGKVVRLRGKRDGIDLIGKKQDAGVYLQENKAKGEIEEEKLQRQLTFDLQTMLYLVALEEEWKTGKLGDKPVPAAPIRGVRYNVVRRPLSGGKNSIKQWEPSKKNPTGETDAQFYKRLGEVIEGDPGFFFMRWKIDVDPTDIQTFKKNCLDPVLEWLCIWYDVMVRKLPVCIPPYQLEQIMTWQHPFGVYNSLDEGGSSDLDTYLATGSEVGLTRSTNLFPELQEAA